ncbi:MAG: hypothetical protein G01um101416_634 [Microgenomates group bacterium Gr01-1014_16]|nr:MAG: hypothetical protein G01um101416_634 [Microgenomates group bacterium Gr01-1014_16]
MFFAVSDKLSDPENKTDEKESEAGPAEKTGEGN